MSAFYGRIVIQSDHIRLELDEQITRQERLRRNSRIWRINHPNRYKKHLEYVRDWKRRNKDRIREYQRNYYRNSEKAL